MHLPSFTDLTEIKTNSWLLMLIIFRNIDGLMKVNQCTALMTITPPHWPDGLAATFFSISFQKQFVFVSSCYFSFFAWCQRLTPSKLCPIFTCQSSRLVASRSNINTLGYRHYGYSFSYKLYFYTLPKWNMFYLIFLRVRWRLKSVSYFFLFFLNLLSPIMILRKSIGISP